MATPFVPISDYTLHWEGSKPYYLRADGSQHFLSPMEVRGIQASAQSDGTPVDPRVTQLLAGGTDAPGTSLLKTRGHWDDQKGEWDQNVNWSNILSMAVGAGIAGPAIAGAASGGGGGAAASSSALLGEGGVPAGLSSAGASSGLLGGSGIAAGAAAPVASSALLGEGGVPAGLSASGASPGLLGGSGSLGGGSLLSTLGKTGKMASGMSQGRASGRVAEQNANLDYDQSRLRSEQQAMRQMVSADLLGSMKPPTDPRAQRFMGNGGSISPQTIAALRAKGQAGLNGGGLQAQPQAGATDSILNGLSTAGQLSQSGILQRIPQIGRYFA